MAEAKRLLKEEKICFRFLEPEEFYKLADIFREYKGTLPNPKLASVAVAELNEEIIGFYVFQLRPHAEPMWIKEEHRKTKIWIKLAAMVEPLTNKYDTYIVATSGEVAKMCEALKLEKVTNPVYVKRINKPLEEPIEEVE